MRHVGDPTQWSNIPKVCEYFISRYPREDYPKTYCKILLRSLRMKKKYFKRAVAQAQWDNEVKSNLKHLESDDWRLALIKNTPAIRELLGLYAKKSRPQ